MTHKQKLALEKANKLRAALAGISSLKKVYSEDQKTLRLLGDFEKHVIDDIFKWYNCELNKLK